MKNIICLIFIFLPLLAFSQKKQQYQHEAGINLVPTLSYFTETNLNRGIDIELFYKRNNFKKGHSIRSKFRLTFDSRPIRHSSRTFHVIDECFVKTSYYKKGFIQSDLGYAKLFSTNSNLKIYLGADVNIGLYNTSVVVDAYYCPNSTSPVPQFNFKNKFKEPYLGLTPVAGMTIPLGKKINITLELGTMLAANFEKIPYYNAEGNLVIEQQGAKLLTTWQESFLLNDIGISYKF